MHNFRSSGEYDNDCTTPLTPLCTQPEQVIKGKLVFIYVKLKHFLHVSLSAILQSKVLCCVCRRCQYYTVPHSEWQATHTYQRYQQQCGFLGCPEGKVISEYIWRLIAFATQVNQARTSHVYIYDCPWNESLQKLLQRSLVCEHAPGDVCGLNCVESVFFFYLQACKGEDLGKVEFDEEIKKRFKMVYVPNWFSVDLKTGVSPTPGNTRAFHLSQQL